MSTPRAGRRLALRSVPTRIRLRSMRARIVAAVIVMMVTVLSVLLAVTAMRTTDSARENAERYLQQTAAHEGEHMSSAIMGPLDTVRTMARTLGTLKSSGVSDRTIVSSVVRDVFAAHPDFVGASSGWEPNAFDGKDANYRDAPGHDATGRVLPYWFRENGELKTAPLTDYDKEGAGDWYLVPRKTGKEAVVDPYVYKVGNDDVLMTTTVSPIIVGGQFVGVATADIDLKNLSADVGKIRPYDAGFATLLTADGTVVAHPEAALLGKRVTDQILSDTTSAAKSGKAVTTWGHDDRLGVDTLTVYEPVHLGPQATWVLALTVPADAVLADATSLRNQFLALGLLSVFGAVTFAWFVGRSITHPLRTLRDRIVEIAAGEGDLSQRVDESRHDEVGELGAAFNRFTGKIETMIVQIQERAGALSDASDRLGQVSDRLRAGSAATAGLTAEAASNVGEVSETVSTVAAGTEEIGASIREIATSVSDAARVGGQAVESARMTEVTVGKLGDSSTQIGDVVKVISAIAEQTNLLALNATIEAARAGEAGKGFAVVANEVKDLAQETGEATGRIAQIVATIQADTTEAVQAIGTISTVISQVNDYQTQIAAAVEEQAATAAEMSRGAAIAAERTSAISGVVGRVAQGAQDTTSVSDATRESAQEMSALAADLSALVGGFRVTGR